jgi:sporulation protein YlmC with PRC-barrel domain
MRLSKGAEVISASGEKIGHISRVVLDAKTRDVTDVVVAGGGLLDRIEKVIPVGLVDLENDDQVILRQTNQGIDDFLDYETTHYVPVERSGAPYENIEATYWYPPVNVQMQMPRAGLISDAVPDQVLQTETSIPEGRIAISEGAEVVSAD